MKIVNKDKALTESLVEAAKQESCEDCVNEEAKLTEDSEGTEDRDGTVATQGGTTTIVDEKDENGQSKDDIGLVVNNALTKVLDRALAKSKTKKARGDEYNANILIIGLPGSSKTRTVEGWAAANGCYLHYLDAKNPDIQLLISGGAYTYKDTDPETGAEVTKIGAAYSDALAPLDLNKNSILFLDELNRQIRDGLRGSLLSLVAGHYVQGAGPGGKHYFNNLLFTIAAINPKTPNETGVVELQDAESRRFFYKVQFDSTIDTTKAYLQAYYDKKLMILADKEVEPGQEAEYISALKSYVLAQHLGMFIADHEAFRYTTFEDICSQDWQKGIGRYTRSQRGRGILCQAVLSDLLNDCDGDVEEAKAWVESEQNNIKGLNDESASMLLEILDDYESPIFEQVVADKEKALGISLLDKIDAETMQKAAEEEAAAAEERNANNNREDDEDWDSDVEQEAKYEEEETNFDDALAKGMTSLDV